MVLNLMHGIPVRIWSVDSMTDKVYERHNPEHKPIEEKNVRIKFLESELKAGAELTAKLSDRIMELENKVLEYEKKEQAMIKLWSNKEIPNG
jgi:hypothetical protein